MTPSLLYALATLALWIGAYLLLVALYKAVRSVFETAQSLRAQLTSAVVWGTAGTSMATLGYVLLPSKPQGSGLAVPVFWPIMPFWAWAAAFSGLVAVVRLVQWYGALQSAVKVERARSAGFWALIGIGCLVLLNTRGLSAKIAQGTIPMNVTAFAVIVLLALGTIVAMAVASKRAMAAGVSRKIASHIALVAGTFLFGIPFAFLVITSFKEDRDMSSPNGIVWVPKVQKTVARFDPKIPLYETTYEGRRVEGVIIEELPDDTVRVDISKPLSIRGTTFVTEPSQLKEIPRQTPIVTASVDGVTGTAIVIEDLEDGSKTIEFTEPATLKGVTRTFTPTQITPVREVGLRWQNYTEALSFMPPETLYGLVYLKNTLILVVLSVIGTLLSSSVAAYAFSRLKFPGRDLIFGILLATLMLPAAVTLLPQFLVFRNLGWVDTLLPLWVPAFLGSAFNIFLLRQFFLGIPMELEDAAKVDGCSYLRTFWSVLLPQIKPALAVVAIWTFMGAWNNFMGPLIYINSPENMPLSYALQLFQSDRGLGEPGLLMAFATLTILPVLLLFFFAQKYFIEGVALSGLGGR